MNIQKTFDDVECFHRILPKIRCEICGREFKQITSTHLKTHGITICKYKEQFPGALLISDALKRKSLEKRRLLDKEFIGRCKPVSIKVISPLDEAFDWHHVDKNHVVAAPRKMHQSIRHTLKKEQTMTKINNLINLWYKTNCGFEFLPLNEETL